MAVSRRAAAEAPATGKGTQLQPQRQPQLDQARLQGRPPADAPLLDALAMALGCAAVAFSFHRYAPAPYMVRMYGLVAALHFLVAERCKQAQAGVGTSSHLMCLTHIHNKLQARNVSLSAKPGT